MSRQRPEVAEVERLKDALRKIRAAARWYAEHGQGGSAGIDRVFCIEVLDYAEGALKERELLIGGPLRR